jgi:hypothetical protein
MNVWHFLGLWLLLSIVLAPLIWRRIHFGMNGPKPESEGGQWPN